MASNTTTRQVKIFINNAEVENNIKSITAEWTKLRREVNLLERGSDAYNKKVAELQRVDSILQQHRDKVSGINKAWDSFKTIFLATLGSNLVEGLLSKMASFFPSVIKGAGQLEDELADIRKTVGYSAEEVQILNTQLGKIDTRTARKELREMAAVAGQLGIAKKDILGFVESTDMLAVALGDEFSGGARQVADEVGRLRNVLSDSKTNQVSNDMLRLGNVLNTLGAEGAATAPVITDFANRIGGMGIPLGLASGEVLGISAAMEELNISAERGGTATSKILVAMTKDIESFAGIANVEVGEFAEMVNTDLYGAFKAVLKGSNEGGSSATKFAAILDKLGLTGSGASEVFAKLSGNIDFMESKVLTATKAIGDSNSITDEFNIKNETLGATIDKLNKDISSLFTSATLTDAIKGFFGVFVDGVTWVKKNGELVKGFGKIILTLAVATATYFAAIKLYALKGMVKAFLDQRLAAIQLAQATGGVSAAQAVLDISITRVKAAFASLGKFLSNPANVFGLLLMALSTAITLYQLFNKEVDYVTDNQTAIANATRSHSNALEKNTDAINNNFNAALKKVGNDKEMKKAVEELNEKYGLNIKFTTNDVALTKDLVKEKMRLVGALQEQYEGQARLIELQETDKKIKEAEGGLTKELGKDMKTYAGGVEVLYNWKFGTDKDEVQRIQQQLDDLRKRRAELKKEAEDSKNKKIVPDENIGGDAGYTPTGDKKKKNKPNFDKDLDKIFSDALDNQDKYFDQVKKILQTSEDKILEIQRLTRDEQLKGYELLITSIGDKYDDLTKAAESSFGQQKASFIDMRDKQLEALDELSNKNKEALKNGDISNKEAEANERKIGSSRIAIRDFYNQTIANQEKELTQTIINYSKARENELKLANERTFKEVVATLKEMNAEARNLIDDIQERGLQFSINQAKERNQLKQARQLIEAEFRLALKRETTAIENEYDERIKLAEEQAETLKKLGKTDEAIAAKDFAIELEVIKQSAINQIQLEFEEERKNRQLEGFREQVEVYQQHADSMAGIYSGLTTIVGNNENKKLARFKNRINAEEKLLDESFRNKAISEAEYNQRKIQLESELKAKENEIMLKQWKRQHALDIVQSVINGALAVGRALAAPPGPPYNLPIVFATGVTAGIQTGIIASQTPPAYGKGEYFGDGPKHTDKEGGLWVMNPRTGKLEATFERGELLLSANTVENNPELVWPLLKASKEENGKRIVDDIIPKPNYTQTIKSVAMNKTGAYYGSTSGTKTTFTSANSTQVNEKMVMELMLQKMDENNMLMQELIQTIITTEGSKQSFVKLTQLQEADKDDKQRKSLASLGKIKGDDGLRLNP